MKSIFLAGPLFNDMEIKRNRDLATDLRNAGCEVFLPQEDVGILYDTSNQTAIMESRRAIFEGDVEGIKVCDFLLILLDGRVPDEGACVELGIAWALGKRCFGLKTDFRAMDEFGFDNIMIEQALEKKFKSTDELLAFIMD